MANNYLYPDGTYHEKSYPVEYPSDIEFRDGNCKKCGKFTKIFVMVYKNGEKWDDGLCSLCSALNFAEPTTCGVSVKTFRTRMRLGLI